MASRPVCTFLNTAITFSEHMRLSFEAEVMFDKQMQQGESNLVILTESETEHPVTCNELSFAEMRPGRI